MKRSARSNHTAVTRLTLLIVTCLMALHGCSSKDEYADLHDFMAEVAARPKGQIAPLPEFEPYQAFTYGTANRRSPFEPPVVIPTRTASQLRNEGVKPPTDHTKQYLERFNIASLSMVGTLSQKDTDFALILDSDGGVHRVEIGDFLGTNWGKIETILGGRIEIVEIVGDGAGGWLRRPKSIELSGEQ